MNHLRNLIDQPALLALTIDHTGATVEENDPAPLFAEVKHKAENAVCFWLGDLDGVCQLSIIPELCRLPYQTCWFEMEMVTSVGKMITAALVTETEDGELHFVSVTRVGREWALDGVAHGSYAAPEMEMLPVDAASLVQLRHNIYAVGAFLSALHCSNVGRAEHLVDAKLQKARVSRGKPPLYSYWTLNLAGLQDGSQSLGGTHAGPRVHLRRGHPRQYAVGKWTWVHAHAVGNKALGVVNKDYSASQLLVKAGMQ